MNTGLTSILRTLCMVTAALTVGGSIFENPAQAQGSDESESIFVPESLSPVNSIYVRSQRLVANDPATNDHFGNSVAISGNTAIVGVPFDDLGNADPNDDHGSAYIYFRDGETWTRQGPKLTASDGEAGDNFGFSVDIDGDTVVIGAYSDDIINRGDDRGSAYIFTRIFTPSGSTWTQQVRLIDKGDRGDPALDAEYFGYSVAIDGNRVIIGARDDKTENNPFSSRGGSASVYERKSDSLWSRLTKIRQAENPSFSNTLFGETVGISGKTVIIGATQYQDRGAAFIYTPGVPDWILQKQLDIEINGERFGNSVAIENGTAVIGQGDRSRAYTSTLSASWSDPVELLRGGSGANAFGHSVALSGDTIVVGTQTEGCTPTEGCRGNAYVYRKKSNGGWTYKAQLFQAGQLGRDFFGASVGVDGNKIMIGARLDASQGSASIFVNVSPRPFDFNGAGVSDISVLRPSNFHWYLRDPITGGFSAIPFGKSGDKIAPADFDGDGKTDIAVFRPPEGKDPPEDQGLWWILNSSTSQHSVVGWGQSGDVPMPNDFDNDGKADVAVFRPSTSTWWWINSSNQQTNAVQFGQSGDVPLLADYDGDARGELAVFRPASRTFTWFNLTTSQTGTQLFGLSDDIPTPGDFDGDSKTDIAVFRPSTSVWYRINSSNGQSFETPFGTKGDIPTVADFDGDGESDIAVFRPSTRVWFITNSSFNDTPGTPQYTFITFGASGDVPVPAAYLR